MPTVYCEFSDLPRDSCAHCTGRTGEKQIQCFQLNEDIQLGPWIDARYHGECSSCSRRIRPGDRIRADGTGGWICEGCGQ